MSRNNLGKIVITPRGIWNEETLYKRLDLVYALNGSFLAREDNQGVSVADTSVWQPVAGRGPAGSGNVSVHETGLVAGKKYLFIPSNNNSAEGIFEEYIPANQTQQQADWSQTQTDQPDFIKNKPAIPGKVSDLENDSQYISASQASASFQEKETGKGLSTNDYTTTEKNKLSGIESGAQKNIPAKHKLVTLQPSAWQLIEDRYRATITDTDIATGIVVVGYTDAKAAILPTIGFGTGEMYIYAEAVPAVSVTLNWNIVNSGASASSGVIVSNPATSFMFGYKTITSLASMVLDKQIIYASILSDVSISVASRAVDGQPSHIYVTNTSAADIEITIPTTGDYISMSGVSKTVPAGGYLEVNIAYDPVISKYRITALEAE